MSETFAYTRSPILLAGSVMPGPFEWADLPRMFSLSAEQQRYLDLARDHGLVFGFTVPLHAPGEPSAVVSFVNDSSRPLNRDILPMAMYAASRAFLAGRRIKHATADHGRAISDHDRRVITYLCRGMSRHQIARKLGIDIRAINAVVTRGCKHYEVSSQTELVVRTLFEQTIRFEDVIH
jgi:LuxR family quorum-sensing system transcriptional regulator CciR